MQQVVELSDISSLLTPGTERQLIAAFAVVFNERGEVLLVQRNAPDRPDMHQCWEIPGGKVEHGEKPTTTAQREFVEETGLTITVDGTKCITQDHTCDIGGESVHTILLAYAGKVQSGQLAVTDESILDAAWVKLEHVGWLRLVSGVREIIEAYSEAKGRE